MSAEKIVDFPTPEVKESPHSFHKRWKHPELFINGYIPLPVVFLRVYAHLKPYSLTPGEAMFVIHLMEYKWGEGDPYPSYKAIAQKMGVSDKLVRRHAQSLETKGYLRRKQRVGDTNMFDLEPLFDAIATAAPF